MQSRMPTSLALKINSRLLVMSALAAATATHHDADGKRRQNACGHNRGRGAHGMARCKLHRNDFGAPRKTSR